MIRKVIKIDEEKCNGCGLCAKACHEGAIGMRDGKAKLLRDDYCDGLGDCLPVCPTGAISFEEREAAEFALVSKLAQWPVQLRLVPVNASYFENADLLVSADCAAYACGSFHPAIMKNKVTLIGCPKLDNEDYSEKLTAILANNNIRSVTVARMEVPCCGGIERAVKTALQNCGKLTSMPHLKIVTIATDGKIL